MKAKPSQWTPGAVPKKRKPGDEITSCLVTVESEVEMGFHNEGKFTMVETETHRDVHRAFYHFNERRWYMSGHPMEPEAGKVIAWMHEPEPYQP